MADAFVELGATGVDKLTDKYFDTAYDAVTKKKPPARAAEIKEQVKPFFSNASASGSQRKQRNRLPSPEGDVDRRDRDFYSDRRSRRRRDSSLERESLTSAQVIDDYESERNDPTRKPESVLSKRDLNKLRRDSKVGSSRMSHANGYADRARSQQPPRSRYGYDDDDSDYDERTGRRYGASGRGYDDDDRGYDREIIETERYKGPARPYDVQRNESYRTSRSYGQDAYGAGAVTQYRRSGEVADYESRRSGRSRSRRRKSERDRSYSDSRSRSRSRSRSKDGIRGKIDETFDTSMRGLGVGLAGAIAGGLAGKQFGKNDRHRERDIIIGAVVGGLGANAAETKWRDWRDEKERKLERDEDRWEQKYEGRDYGRSRSAMR